MTSANSSSTTSSGTATPNRCTTSWTNPSDSSPAPDRPLVRHPPLSEAASNGTNHRIVPFATHRQQDGDRLHGHPADPGRCLLGHPDTAGSGEFSDYRYCDLLVSPAGPGTCPSQACGSAGQLRFGPD